MSATPHPTDPHPTLVDLLLQRAQDQPQQPIYTFLKAGETPTQPLTYGELDQQARRIGAWLQTQLTAGDRVLLVYPYEAGLEFIAAFLGCLYAGMVAVSSHPPRNRAGLMEGVARWKAAEASALLSTQKFLPKLKTQLNAPDLLPEANYPSCATDTLPASLATEWRLPHLQSEQLAFLQYTSGSTGTPKGVMVTHGSLMQNQQLLKLAFGHTAESVGVGWLPLFHDMGLIGNALQALYLGASCVLMSPIDFVQKPSRWLQAISRYGATTSGGPNFAYDLLCRKVTDEQLSSLDLSRWEVAFTGAEPIRLDTIERFSQKFAPCGFRREAFYPCYGMAEATLFVSGGPKLVPLTLLQVDAAALEQHQVVVMPPPPALTRSLVGCGQAWLDTKIAIVDPQTHQRCLPEQVGEIWLAGSGLGQGYWHQPTETAQTFQAQIDYPSHQPTNYLRTGDLGFLYQGELFITGRLHDVMVFWGFNHYPQQIEQTVERCHPGFSPDANAAFAVKLDEEERLIVVQEVERTYRHRITIEEVVESIRWRVFEEHFVDVYGIILIKPGSLPKTSSGKVQRSACRALYLSHQLDILSQWHSTHPCPDPTAMMERYLNLTTHAKRYIEITQGRIQRWLTANRS